MLPAESSVGNADTFGGYSAKPRALNLRLDRPHGGTIGTIMPIGRDGAISDGDTAVLTSRRFVRSFVKFQAWILLDGEDAGQDATFLHTPNANGTPFPFVPPEIEWGASSAINEVVKSYLPDLVLHFGWTRTMFEEEGSSNRHAALWIFAEGIGEPLTQEAG